MLDDADTPGSELVELGSEAVKVSVKKSDVVVVFRYRALLPPLVEVGVIEGYGAPERKPRLVLPESAVKLAAELLEELATVSIAVPEGEPPEGEPPDEEAYLTLAVIFEGGPVIARPETAAPPAPNDTPVPCAPPKRRVPAEG